MVEDNPGDVRLTQEAFKESSLKINSAWRATGSKRSTFCAGGVNLENAPRPDLILLDLNLPRKNGREVLQEIKNDPDLRRIPVVIMTTSTAEPRHSKSL